MVNIMTFDVEEWFHSNLPSIDGKFKNIRFESRLEKPVYRILDLLERTRNSATFFVLGMIAEEQKRLLRDIHSAGHEIASHGFSHQLIYHMTPKEFKFDIEKSVKTIEDIISEKVIGFRSPSWSVPKGVSWYWEALLDSGFLYDSSMFPFKTFMYGSNNYLRGPHWIEIQNRKILEWPPSVLEIFGKRIPFSGGFYFRLIPEMLIRRMIDRFTAEMKTSVVLYLHPWEMDFDQPRIDMSLRDRLIHRTNVKRSENKLERILTRYNFTSFRDELQIIYREGVKCINYEV